MRYKHEDVKKYVGKYVRVYISGGYQEGILYEDSDFKFGSAFYMKEHTEYYVSKKQTQSRYSVTPCYFGSVDGIKNIEEVDTDESR